MIRFAGEDEDGGRLLGIGLSRANCDRLLDGKPIAVDFRKDFNCPWRGSMLLVAADTDEAMASVARSYMPPDSIIHRDHGLEDPPVPPVLSPPWATLQATVDAVKGVVVIDLHTDIRRFGLTPENARLLAAVLTAEAEKADQQRAEVLKP